MATVTKLKAEINNKNLPVLTTDGEIINYYLGMFVNKLEDNGYSLTNSEKAAVNTFIESGLNSWMDYVYYCAPFIGDAEHWGAGLVPLIDNIDNYRMTEYVDGVSYEDRFEYANGKIIGVYNSTLSGQYFKSPLEYSKDNGFFAMFCARLENGTSVSASNNVLVSSQVVNDGGENKYLHETYASNMIYFWKDGSNHISLSSSTTLIENSITNNRNIVLSAGIYVKDNVFYAVQAANLDGTKVFRRAPLSSFSWDLLNYGKMDFGRNMNKAHLKTFLFIDPNISQGMVEQLSNDVNTLVTALGR